MDELSLAVEFQRLYGPCVTCEQLAFIAGVRPAIVRRLHTLGAIQPQCGEDTGQPLFELETALRVRRFARIRRDLGVGWSAMPLVDDLLARIDALEAELARARRDFPSGAA